MIPMTFTPHPQKKHKSPKVAEDGCVLTEISPYYVYICANRDCGCCGWVERWVDKQNNHKCSACKKTMVRVANPKEIEKEDFPTG
jgi:hypothetical protein